MYELIYISSYIQSKDRVDLSATRLTIHEELLLLLRGMAKQQLLDQQIDIRLHVKEHHGAEDHHTGYDHAQPADNYGIILQVLALHIGNAAATGGCLCSSCCCRCCFSCCRSCSRQFGRHCCAEARNESDNKLIEFR